MRLLIIVLYLACALFIAWAFSVTLARPASVHKLVSIALLGSCSLVYIGSILTCLHIQEGK